MTVTVLFGVGLVKPILLVMYYLHLIKMKILITLIYIYQKMTRDPRFLIYLDLTNNQILVI